MDDRRLTCIIVPHTDAETRSFELSYRRLKWLVGLAGAFVLAFVLMAATWFYLATQVARVPGLEREVRLLEQEKARVAELARTLAEVEAQYEKVRQLLGADGAPQGRAPYLPPLNDRRRQPAEGSGDEVSLTDRRSDPAAEAKQEEQRAYGQGFARE